MSLVLLELVEDDNYLTEVGIFSGEDYHGAMRIPRLVHLDNCDCYHCVRYHGVAQLYSESFICEGVYGYFPDSDVCLVVVG